MNDKSPPSLQQQLQAIPKLHRHKVRKLADAVIGVGVELDEDGYVPKELLGTSNKIQIIPYLLAAVKGKDTPIHWIPFLEFLATIKIPRDLLAPKVKTEMRKLKRNAKTDTT